MGPRLRTCIAFWTLVALTGCASRPIPPTAPAATPAPDPSDNWHVLIVVPFGTLLKDSPVALHEVLLFRDAAHGAGPDDERDCFAMDGTQPPRFIGQRPDEYLLCFDHDRLNRVETTVRLPADSAGSRFAAACAEWIKSGAPGRVAPDSCEGREGTTRFSARLGNEPSPTTAQPTATLSISLISAAP
jgi:hypothetical protein